MSMGTVLLQQKSVCALKRFMLQVASVFCEPVVSQWYIGKKQYGVRFRTTISLLRFVERSHGCATAAQFQQRVNLSKFRLFSSLP